MTQVAPYTETESLPRGRRVLLVPVATAFLVGPYSTLTTGAGSALSWVVCTVAVALGALLLGVAIAKPRRRLTIDPQSELISIDQTSPTPRLGLVHTERPFAAVEATEIRETGTQGRPDHGFQPVITLTGGGRIPLRVQGTAEQAQSVIDRLVLLGLPGRSRAAIREEQLAAPPPTTWL